MSHSCPSRRRVAGVSAHHRLVEIAEVLDQVSALRAQAYVQDPFGGDPFEGASFDGVSFEDATFACDAPFSAAPVTNIADAADTTLRSVLFELLDEPGQEAWESAREVEVLPSYFPGLSTPSPLGTTLGDLVYALGLPDRECPTRETLLRALRSAAEQFGTPMPG
jgi:hypothetical protein